MMMMLSSLLLAVSCLIAPTLSKPATIVSGFGMEEVLKQAQNEHDRMAAGTVVDSSPEHAPAPVVDGSTDDSHSHESSHQPSSTGSMHVGPDTIVSGREHIHDPEHGNGDVIFGGKHENPHGKMQKVTTEMFGADDGVEVGGNSEPPKGNHHPHHGAHKSYNPEFGMEKQDFKNGWAPTEIVWSPSVMSNGYNGGVRRPEYRHVFAQRH